MIRIIISFALCLFLTSFSFAGGTFGDINRGKDHVPAFSGDEPSKQEMQDIERQEEQSTDTESGEITDEGELGTFRIQTQKDMIRGEAAEKNRQQKRHEAVP